MMMTRRTRRTTMAMAAVMPRTKTTKKRDLGLPTPTSMNARATSKKTTAVTTTMRAVSAAAAWRWLERRGRPATTERTGVLKVFQFLKGQTRTRRHHQKHRRQRRGLENVVCPKRRGRSALTTRAVVPLKTHCFPRPPLCTSSSRSRSKSGEACSPATATAAAAAVWVRGRFGTLRFSLGTGRRRRPRRKRKTMRSTLREASWENRGVVGWRRWWRAGSRKACWT
mmetsp:Transcript_32363/g.65977  ORF Transcript_32363/g.65977 Transcript_32363/m.65977 type:complete len:225 (-) Transcript_32363:682-1356(-)